MKRKVLVMFALLLVLGTVVFAQEVSATAAAASADASASAETALPASVWKYFAAAIAVGISCIAGGMAVGRIGAAAMGAMSENAELSGKALPYAGLAEGICLWGFLVALLILVL